MYSGHGGQSCSADSSQQVASGRNCYECGELGHFARNYPTISDRRRHSQQVQILGLPYDWLVEAHRVVRVFPRVLQVIISLTGWVAKADAPICMPFRVG